MGWPRHGRLLCGLEDHAEGWGLLSSPDIAGSKKIYFDMAHGEAPWPPQMGALEKRVGYQIEAGNGPIAAEALAGSRLIYLRAPNRAFQDSEQQAIISFVKAGGSLLLVLDEEERQKLAVVGVTM
jgi:hypothetical protein